MESVRFDELVDPTLSSEALIFRLFNSMEPHVAQAQEVRDKCRCSPERVESMLEKLDPADIAELADTNRLIEIVCEFCKIKRHFHIDKIRPVSTPR